MSDSVGQQRAREGIAHDSPLATQGLRVLILGLAREGASLARFFAHRGARVTVTDAQPADRLESRIRSIGDTSVQLALGGDHPELVAQADMFFVSPGVPETNPVYRAALDARLPIRSMTTLFFDLCPAPIVGITGSSGKTTTTGLIGRILRHAGRDVVVGGNIGEPMLDLLTDIGPRTVVVLELSSFQLSILERGPRIAVITNITPNHLDRHGTMEDYIAAKRRIVQYQGPGDYAVLNALDSEVMNFARCTPASIRCFAPDGEMADGATTRAEMAGVMRNGVFHSVLPVSDIPLLGRHNVENVLAALAASDVLGVAEDAMERAVRSFRPAPHRLQTVAEHAGVRYIDDSIATSPARAGVALQSLTAPVILIAGGRDKNLPWEDFAEIVARKARALILIGEAAPVIEEAVRRRLTDHPSGLLRGDTIRRCPSLPDAVTAAKCLAVPGDVVLLAPACTSYDMFTDFEERGRVFAEAVDSILDVAQVSPRGQLVGHGP